MRVSRSIASLIAFTFALMISSACAPSSQVQNQHASTNELELTDEMINERINGAFLTEVPEQNGAGETISWRFIPSEPKEIKIVDKQVNGDRATIVLNIKTSSSPRSQEQRQLAGQIRTEWEIKKGWALRQWEIVGTENVSMKYRNLPKTAPDIPQP